MRFFTLEWWIGQQQAHNRPPDPFDSYRVHFAKIENELPQDLIELEQRGALHDAKVRAFRLDLGAETFELDLMTWGPNGGDLAMRLHYGGVAALHGTADPDRGLPGPRGFGDLGYSEIHVIDDAIEHWLLFSSGIELHVRFKSFELRSWAPTADAGSVESSS